MDYVENELHTFIEKERKMLFLVYEIHKSIHFKTWRSKNTGNAFFRGLRCYSKFLQVSSETEIESGDDCAFHGNSYRL